VPHTGCLVGGSRPQRGLEGIAALPVTQPESDPAVALGFWADWCPTQLSVRAGPRPWLACSQGEPDDMHRHPPLSCPAEARSHPGAVGDRAALADRCCWCVCSARTKAVGISAPAGRGINRPVHSSQRACVAALTWSQGM